MKEGAMKAVGVADLKAHLSEHLRAVREGQELTVLARRIPVARIVPVGAGPGLVVRPARGSLQDLSPPVASGGGPDVLDDLLNERAERS